MKLKDLAAKPKLIPILLDSTEIVEQYGEALEFFIWDRQPIQNFIRIATTMNTDYAEAVTMMNEMILDDEGKAVCGDGNTLPSAVMTAAIHKVIEQLGK
jgi:hypothetical protein